MKLSRSITGIVDNGSDGWETFYRARRMKADGAPVIELTIGEHDRGTDRSILDAMHESALSGNTGYAAVPGSPALRERIAARIAERTGVATGPENVLVVPGGQAALLYAHHAVCNPGDTALFIDPHYATFPGTIRAVGAKPLAIRASAENGFLPDPRDVARAADGAASLLINSPNNPTGAVYGERILEGLARVARDHGLWVVSDEVYDTQVWDGAHLSIRACDAMAAQTLVVGSLSKSHAMTGSRIGWVVGPEEAIAHMENLALCANYGVAGFVQDAALFALGLGAEFERRVAAPFLRRRDLALKRIAAQRIVRAARPAGAMYLMLDIRETGLSGREFAERLLDERLVAVMPGESFGAAASGHVRVALTVDDESLAHAIDGLLDLAADVAAQSVPDAA